MSKQNQTEAAYGYGPLTAECARRGIGRTFAYKLIKRGLLDTFMLGKTRYVYIRSLESLPERVLLEAQPRRPSLNARPHA